MSDPNTAPAEACAPDPDRADPDSPDPMPHWVAYLLALLILFLMEHSQTVRQRQLRRLALARAGRPAPSQASTQSPADTIPGQPDNMTAPTCRGRRGTPECPELPGMLQALLDRLQQSDGGPSLWSQLEAALGIGPGLIGPNTAAAPALTPRRAAINRRAARGWPPGGPRHAVSLAPPRWIFTHASTGPPTGPPAASRCQSCYA